MADQEIGWGIIGCGMIGPHHANALDPAQGARLVCACDLVEAKAQEVAEKWGADYTTDMGELLARDDIQAVSICTPSGMHADHAIAAAEAGKHILCEKPIDIVLSRIDEMIQAAEECNVKLSCVFQSRTAPDNIRVREALRNGKLGKLVLGDCYQKFFRAHEYYASAGWRATWELDGGGCFMNQGVRGVDLIQWLMGKAARVNAHARHLTRNITVEDSAVAIVEWECGALGVLEATTSISPGTGTRLEIAGNDGMITLENGKIVSWEVPGEDAATTEDAGKGAAADPQAITSEGHTAHMEDLVQAIRDDRAPAIGGREARHAVEIIKAIYLSSREGGATVELPLSYDDDGPGILPRLGAPGLEW